MSGHILAKDKSQLAKQLTSLLVSYQHLPHIKKLFKKEIKYLKTATQYKNTPWLCLLSSTISSPLAQPLIRTLTGHSLAVGAVAVTPDGKKLISGSCDGTIKVWDLATGNLENTLKNHSYSINILAVTTDSKKVISGSRDQTLKIWDLDTENLENTLKNHSYSINILAVTTDSKKVISGSRDQTLKIWDLDTENLENTLKNHSYSINILAVTTDSKKVISGSDDKTLKIWDLKTENCIATFTAEASITCVAVAPDGVSIIAGDSSGNVHFLRLMGV
ncbi:WD40 repeat domain-containing protein [Crocosphaera chwakensis]|uniref:Serine/Threonine protein kinase with WD40 repeats n=1 Tax=Crocosphaera chwakensis CCY0110 TaxID=391612 RepID=A3IT74_9CHRO|nr:WD40 repeat domain-containing protein [Crocosphaera chwakensis]EAZ90378.1 Serine/Threonine protein kinase with WD40 repeats [Crocosphaera chwakensis CCY0110]